MHTEHRTVRANDTPGVASSRLTFGIEADDGLERRTPVARILGLIRSPSRESAHEKAIDNNTAE